MKVPPTNNSNGFSAYPEDHYFSDMAPMANGGGAVNGNGMHHADEFVPVVPRAEDADFSEYMWMENEEEFDKEVLQRLEEEELMEQCMLQHMLDNDRPVANGNSTATQNGVNNKSELGEVAKCSTLNPHAAEFVPSWSRTPVAAEQKSS